MNFLEQRLAIPYTKLRFCLLFPEEAQLPQHKVSALRGGMGEMLLRQNCVRDRDCEACEFKEACIVHHTLYTQMKKKPPFMHGNDSIGYLIECENYRTRFAAGDEMFFCLVLFGNNIAYFSQYLQAFYQLGISGVGKDKARYIIKDIRNLKGRSLLEDSDVLMKRYCYETVGDYVSRRLDGLKRDGIKNEIEFHTPVTLKYHGEYLDEFDAEAVCTAVLRRVEMLDYFVGVYLEPPAAVEYPQIIEQHAKLRSVERYSATQDSRMTLKGITGRMRFNHVDEALMKYLLAGELLHIGKNSSFGFGRYTFS